MALAARGDDIQTINMATPPGQMKYDRPVIRARPGSQLKLVFQNNDEMPHNIVFCLPKEGVSDKGLEVAMEAWKLADKGEARGWVPDHPRVWAHSGMVPAHKQEELLIKVPQQPGTYPYVCTFPGHAMAMNGELRVLAEGPGFQELTFKLFLGDWSKLPDFIQSLKRILADDSEYLLPSHGPVFKRDNTIIQKAIDRLTQYQHMADFGTCAVDWPLLDEWERDITEGRKPVR